jgi:hypothetical protein
VQVTTRRSTVSSTMQSSLSLQDLEQFLSSAADASTRFVAEKSSVVFVMPEREEEARMALTWLYGRAGRGGDVPLSYFPLPNLLHAMAKSLLPEASLATYCPNVFQAAFVLDQTIKFFFAPGVSCDAFHADLDCENGCCALGRAKVCAYLLANFLCPSRGSL